MRLICGAEPRQHCKPSFIQLQLLTVHAKYVLDCLIYVKQHINDFCFRNSVHNYSTRQSNNIFIDFKRYSRTLKSFEVIALKMFNVLPSSVKNLPERKFKVKLKDFLIVNPLYSTSEFFNLDFNHV